MTTETQRGTEEHGEMQNPAHRWTQINTDEIQERRNDSLSPQATTASVSAFQFIGVHLCESVGLPF
jgi:hypothetical protein